MPAPIKPRMERECNANPAHSLDYLIFVPSDHGTDTGP